MAKFKRSLIGFDAASVAKVIHDREARFGIERQALSRELAGETHQLELLRVEVAEAREDFKKKLELKKEISQQLLEAYIQSTEQRLVAISAAEQGQRQLIDKIAERSRELDVLKREMQDMHKDFYAVAERYKKILNK